MTEEFAPPEESVSPSSDDLSSAERAYWQAIHDAYYRTDFRESSRHFTDAGYGRVNALLAAVSSGDREARSEFIAVVQPWIGRIHEQIAQRLLGDKNMDKDTAAALQVEALDRELHLVEKGSIKEWNLFSQSFQQRLQRAYELFLRKRIRTVRLEKAVPNPAYTHRTRSDAEERTALQEKMRIPRHEGVPSPAPREGHQWIAALEHEQRDAIERVLGTLTYREREVLNLRFGLGDGYEYSAEEVGRIFKVTPERIRQIEAKATSTLQHPIRSNILEPFAPPIERPLETVKRMEAEKAHTKQRLINRSILQELGAALIAQKKVLHTFLCLGEATVQVDLLCNKAYVPQSLVLALSDIEKTQIDDLIRALNDDKMIHQLRKGLRFLCVREEQLQPFDEAISELKRLMTVFAERGGKPLTHSST